jgi:glycosyltransferase involved in cell wall biosynthesis
LDWFTSELVRWNEIRSLFVLLPGRPGTEPDLTSCLPGEVRLFSSQLIQPVLALIDLHRLLDSDHYLVLGLESVLLPVDIPRRLVDIHLGRTNDFTYLGNVPDISPIVVSRTWIERAANHPMAAEAFSLRQMGQSFSTLEASSAATSSAPPLRSESVLLTPMQEQFVTGEFRVDLHSPEAMGWLREIIEEDAIEPLPRSAKPVGARLDRWLRKKHEALRRSLAQPHSPPSERPKRVLYVCVSAALSGGEISLWHLLNHLDRNRFRAEALVSCEGNFAAFLRSAASPVHTVQFNLGCDPLESWAYCRARFRESSPSVLHFNGYTGLPVLLAAREHAIPLVQHVRVPFFGELSENLKAADVVIAISTFVQERLLRVGVPPDKIHVVSNSVDLDHYRPDIFNPAEARRSLGIEDGKRVLLCVARYVPQKRIELVVRAFQRLARKDHHLRLLLVGESHEAPQYHDLVQRLIRQCDSASGIIQVPSLPDIRVAFAASDVLALVSQDEPWGRCAVEAMAMEVPVVLSDSGALPEVGAHGEAALLTPLNDDAAVADAISRLLDDQTFAAALCQRALAHVRTRYDPHHSAQAMMSIYDQLTA